MKTSNPMLKRIPFKKEPTNTSTMTIGGTVRNTFVMLILLLAASVYSYLQMMQGSMKTSVLIGVAIVNIVVAFLAIFIPRISPICAPIYAVVKGIVLGSISAYYTMRFGDSILLTAVLLTISILFAMLVLYATRIIKVTEKFRAVLTLAATLGILIMYLIVFLLNTFVLTVPYIHQGGTISIIISAVVIVVAALNLLLDFDSIENGARSGAAKYMEWYSAIGLMMTLVWLYLEILRFVSYFMKNEE
jgi:uncharacterized YccA/Bax inhibitor family protein